MVFNENSKGYEILRFTVIYFSIFFMVYVIEVILFQLGYSVIIRYSLEAVLIIGPLTIVSRFLDGKFSIFKGLIMSTFVGGLWIAARRGQKFEQDVESNAIGLSFILPSLTFIVYACIFTFIKLTGIVLFPLPSGNSIIPANISLTGNVLSLRIISNNLLLVVGIFFGSFALYLGSAISLFFNAALLTSLIINSTVQVSLFLILPNGVLEIAGIFLSSAGGALLIYLTLVSLYRPVKLSSQRYRRFVLGAVITIIALTLILFLVAWGIEYFNTMGFVLHNRTYAPLQAYRVILFSDLLIIAGICRIISIMINEQYLSILRFILLIFFPILSILLSYPSLLDHISVFGTVPVFLAIGVFLISFDTYISTGRKRGYISEFLNQRGFSLTASRGGSMFPTIKTGDLLLYKKVTKAEEIREGQIVVFVPRTVMAGLSFEKFICHRFLKIEEGRMITKGDSLTHADPWTPVENIEGVVVSKVQITPEGELFTYEHLVEDSETLNHVDFLLNELKELEKVKNISLISKRKIPSIVQSTVMLSLGIILSTMVFFW